MDSERDQGLYITSEEGVTCGGARKGSDVVQGNKVGELENLRLYSMFN
jgi:hypothetical protein